MFIKEIRERDSQEPKNKWQNKIFEFDTVVDGNWRL